MFIGPRDSTAIGWKKWVFSRAEYLSILRRAASSAAEPTSLAQASTYESASKQQSVSKWAACLLSMGPWWGHQGVCRLIIIRRHRWKRFRWLRYMLHTYIHTWLESEGRVVARWRRLSISQLRFDCDTIRLRQTTTKSWHVRFLLTSNPVEWKQARDTSWSDRSRIAVEIVRIERIS